jgi:hypothetical protein
MVQVVDEAGEGLATGSEPTRLDPGEVAEFLLPGDPGGYIR